MSVPLFVTSQRILSCWPNMSERHSCGRRACHIFSALSTLKTETKWTLLTAISFPDMLYCKTLGGCGQSRLFSS